MIIQLARFGRRDAATAGWRRADGGRPRRPQVRFAPVLDPVEDRTLLSTFTVTNNHDSGKGSLRAAIAEAASGDTIDFAPNLDGRTIRLTSGELDISTGVDIEGPGAGRLTISGCGSSRVFNVTTSGVDVTIAGVTIADGLAPQGGGIIDRGGTLALDGDALVDDQAIGFNPGDTAQGGGVFVTVDATGNTGALTVRSCTFVSDVAQGAPGLDDGTGAPPGGGGSGLGGGIEGDQGVTIDVAGSSFPGDQALGGRGGNSDQGSQGTGPGGGGGFGGGGAIFTDQNATLMVSGSSFHDNLAQGGPGGYSNSTYAPGDGGNGSGGAIMTTGWFSFDFPPDLAVSLGVSDSSFTGNTAQAGAGGAAQDSGIGGAGGYASAGAITCGAGTAAISGSQLIGNRAEGARGGEGPLGGTGGYTGGGAIIAGDSTILNVSTSLFQQNTSVAGDGGTSTHSPQSLHGLAGWADGGAIEADCDSDFTYPVSLVFTVSQCAFTGNVAQGGIGDEGGEGWGGGVFVIPGDNANFQITDSRFTANRAIGGDATSGDLTNPSFPFSQAGGDGLGGGLMTSPFSSASGVVSGCIFDENVTQGGNGGAGGPGAKGGFGGSAGGSGIAAASFDDTLDVESTRFVGNRAIAGQGGAGGSGADGGNGGDDDGAGLDNSGATLTLDSSSFVLNTTVAGAGGDGRTGGDGGSGGDAYGGGLEVEGNVAIGGSVFEGNFSIAGAGGDGGSGGGGIGGLAVGGGIAEEAFNSTSTLDDSSVTFDAAIGGAGGSGSSGGDAQGGGISIVGAAGGTISFAINSSTVSHNRATGGDGGSGGNGLGGGIYADATASLSLTGVSVQHNLAFGGYGAGGGADGQGIGGGVYVLGTFSEDPTTVIDQNRASTRDPNIGP